MSRRPKVLTEDMRKASLERETATGTKGMVVTAHPIASDIGRQVLEEGGNAVDAAVAIQFALNVVEPMMTGIGGSGFLMVYQKEQNSVQIFNGHTRAPKAVHKDMFLDKNEEVIPFRERSTHASAVGIPGILSALNTALKKYGSMPLADLIQPSIEVAEEGIEVNWVLSNALEQHGHRLGEHAKTFFYPEGAALKEGDILIKDKLANTYRILQEKGIKAFYEGEIAEAIIKELKEQGGIMELEDLKQYSATIDEPVWGEYRGHKIASAAPPTAGGITMLQTLKILELFDLKKYDIKSKEKYYLFLEAMRLAFADKVAFSGDPEFSQLPTKGLLDEQYIKERVKYINFKRRNDAIDFGNPWKLEEDQKHPVVDQPNDMEKSETTHFTVVDQWGNIASCTSTVEHPFGSGIMISDYGFMLNNELTDFDANPGGTNEPGPWKRPVSCKTPTILFKDDKPVLTLGSPGGPTIIASVFQTIVHYLDFGLSLKEAIDEPRIFVTTGPLVEWESEIDKAAKGELEAMGFDFGDEPSSIGNVQAIAIDGDGILHGAADASREGKAFGLND